MDTAITTDLILKDRELFNMFKVGDTVKIKDNFRDCDGVIASITKEVVGDKGLCNVYLVDCLNETNVYCLQSVLSLVNDPKKDFTATHSGIQFFPLDPIIEHIHIQDIAHALSNICRYGGHTSRFYSVAEHSIHVTKASMVLYPKDTALHLWLLLHDATEAYILDVVKPLKKHLVGYEDIESNLEKAVQKRFNLGPKPEEIIRFFDDSIIWNEKEAVMANSVFEWNMKEGPLNCVEISKRQVKRKRVKKEFLRLFEELINQRLLKNLEVKSF